ncbi:MAG: DUF4249 family protein [Ignavibacteriales bacterium]|nr:MAG: DUF4249 family protein [Ignavibacteriales bacterium]
MNKIKYLVVLVIGLLSLAGCGEGKVDISEAEYEPKIVVDAYIYPGKKVELVYITRNVPLDKNFDLSKVLLTDANARITDLTDGKIYMLEYNPSKLSYEYNGSDLAIQNGKSYKLEVEATIDGKNLRTSSVTTVPLNGFNINKLDPEVMKYRLTDENDIVKKINVSFSPAANAEIYGISITALNPTIKNFIYDNAYHSDLDTNDVIEDFDSYKQQMYWLQNSKNDATQLDIDVEWHAIWFYTDYRVIIYAGDKNFKDFLLTHKNVQEMDGNFHEPKLHLEGDGIGVFASAIPDTVYFRIIK